MMKKEIVMPKIGLDMEEGTIESWEKKVGDRVAGETHIPCNHCWFCDHGMKHICKNMKLFGVSVPGAFAEYAF